MYFITIFHNLIEIYLDFITTRFYTTLRTTSNNIRNNLRIHIGPRVHFLIRTPSVFKYGIIITKPFSDIVPLLY